MSEETEQNESITESKVLLEGKSARSEQVKAGIRRMSPERKRARIVELAAQEIPLSDIARIVGMPKSTVKATIDRFKPVFTALDRVEEFNQVKADILSAAQLVALESAMSPRKLAKASFLASITGAEKLHKMERLERGKSTENIAHGFGRLPTDDDVSD